MKLELLLGELWVEQVESCNFLSFLFTVCAWSCIFFIFTFYCIPQPLIFMVFTCETGTIYFVRQHMRNLKQVQSQA